MKKNILVLISLSVCLLSACQENQSTVSNSDEKKQNALYQEFKAWEAKQNPQLLQEYKAYLAENLDHPPSLFELSFNAHIRRPECLQYRFALAEKTQWKNVVRPLKLIESLKTKGVIENYKITSIYRDKKSNECAKGASRSKHLGNYAVDFQVLNAKGEPYHKDDFTIQKKLCDYWKNYGRRQNLGLGTYLNHKFHVDVQGFRTWGYTYKNASSTCI